MKAKQKTTYPLYVFRISPDDKDWLESELTKVHARVNRDRKNLGKDESGNLKYPHPIKKNEILMQALRHGLPKVKLD